MKIGIDIGNVIIGSGGEDTSFFGGDFEYLETPEVVGAFESIKALKIDGHELHVVSKCGEAIESKSVHWLRCEGFEAFILRHRTHFVRKRHLKAPMAQALELDIFIDDHQDIIDSMKDVVKHPILFTSWEQTNKELEKIFNDQA